MHKLLLTLLSFASLASAACPTWVGQATAYAVGAVVNYKGANYVATQAMDNGWIDPTNTYFWSTSTSTSTCATGAGSGTGTTGAALAALGYLPAYMEIGGIPGSVQLAGKEGTIEVTGFDHQVFLPIVDGAIAGTRRHDPIVVTKAIDRASVPLYRILATGEALPKITIKFYQLNDQGEEAPFYQVELTKCKIASVRSHQGVAGARPGFYEDVQIRYEKISWTFLEGNLTFQDEWNSR